MEATVTDVMRALEMSAGQFMSEWKTLSDTDKQWFKDRVKLEGYPCTGAVSK